MFSPKDRGASGNLAIMLIIGIVLVIMGLALYSGNIPSLTGRIVGSGNLVSKDLDFSDFKVIKVGNGFEVEITQSSSHKVSITADDNVINRIETSKTGDTLNIHLRTGVVLDRVTLKAEITMPELKELELSGGTHSSTDGFISDKLILELSGGSHLEMSDMSLGEVDIELSGGSHIAQASGEADDVLIRASSGSHLDLSDLQVHNADVKLDGGSHATINLDGRLDADISGGSHLKYIGEPTMGDIQSSGGSSIEKK